jgi:hypothetical protein
VIRLLDDPYVYVQSEAIEYLARAGSFEPAVRARIADLAQNARNVHLKHSALTAMGELTNLSEAEIAILAEAIGDADEGTQRAGAASLLSARVPAGRAIPLVLPLLSSKEIFTRMTAVEKLEGAVREQQIPLLSLAEAASATSDSVARGHILTIIDTSDSVDATIAPALTKLLGDSQPSVSQAAARLIGRSGTTDPASLAELEKAMHGYGVRRMAILAYEHLIPGSGAAEEAAAGLLDNSDSQLRLAAAIVLAVHGNGAAQAQVREALSSNDSKREHVALEGLRNLPAAADLFQREIEPLLQSPNLLTRRYAAELLVQGSSSDLAIQTLNELLDRNEPVAGILRKAGAKAADAVPSLQKALERGMESAVPALCELAPAELATESFQKALGHGRAEVRAAASAAIGEIGQAPESVVKRLEALSHDRDQDVRIAARASLARLTMTA